MRGETIFCRGEYQRFPIEEFRKDETGAWVHSVRPEHYANTGAVLEPQPMPSLLRKTW